MHRLLPSKKQSSTIFPSYAPLFIYPLEEGISGANLLLPVISSISQCFYALIAFGRFQQTAPVL